MNNALSVKIFGSADCLPAKNNDGANYLIGDKLKLDLGWFSVGSLLNADIDPSSIDTLLLTHMHTDHTMALTQLLMYRWVTTGSVDGLTIVGPKEQLRGRYEAAYEYTFWEYPELRANRAFGDATLLEWDSGDEAVFGDYKVESTSSKHALPGLCYRITHMPSGHSVGFSGDTMYQEKYDEFFRDCDVLFYECSWGEGPLNDELNKDCKHSSVYEAVKAAEQSNSKRLVLTHCRTEKQAAAFAKAKTLSDMDITFARFGDTVEF